MLPFHEVAYIEHQDHEIGTWEWAHGTCGSNWMFTPCCCLLTAALEKLRYADAELEIRDLKVSSLMVRKSRPCVRYNHAALRVRLSNGFTETSANTHRGGGDTTAAMRK